jgi:excisionase family DNA binding protein
MRLINQLHPAPLEGLASFLERLRQANYYEEASWFQEFLPGSRQHRLDLLREASHYQALADLTGLSVDMLKQLTLHRFVPNYYQQEELSRLPTEFGDLNMPMWETRGLARYVHGQRYWKLCPLCWKEQRVALLPWSLRHVTCCLTHTVLLVDRCSDCGELLRTDFVNGRCAGCGKEVSTLATISIRDHLESMTLTSIVWTAILCDPACFPPKSSPFDYDHPLRQMSAPNLNLFLWRFAHLLVARDPHNPLFDPVNLLPGTSWDTPPADLWSADVASAHGVLAAIVKLILSWPNAWYATLARLIEAESSGTPRTVHFPRILAEQFTGAAWTWLHRSWVEFMWWRIAQKADIYPWIRYFYQLEEYFKTDFGELEPSYQFQRYFREKYFPDSLNNLDMTQQNDMNERPPPLTLKTTARLLGMGEPRLKHHLERGDLRTLPRSSKGIPHQWYIIDAESVRQLQVERKSFLALAQAAAYCGTSEEQIVALVAMGLVRAEHGPLIDKSPTWSFTKDALQQFLERLLGGLPVKPSTSSSNALLSLSQVLRIFSAIGERLPGLLQAIEQGSFPAFRDQEATGLQSLWFEQPDVITHLERIQQARERHVYTVEETCKYLHCKPPVLQRWHESGLLVPCRVETGPTGTRKWYAIQDVSFFSERYVMTDVAAEILGYTELTVQRWAKAGRLPTVTGPDIDGSHTYRFDRAVLVQWRHERLTVGEAANLLGVSVATIDRWAKEGKMKPLQDMGGKQRWFSRQALSALRETG